MKKHILLLVLGLSILLIGPITTFAGGVTDESIVNYNDERYSDILGLHHIDFETVASINMDYRKSPYTVIVVYKNGSITQTGHHTNTNDTLTYFNSLKTEFAEFTSARRALFKSAGKDIFSHEIISRIIK